MSGVISLSVNFLFDFRILGCFYNTKSGLFMADYLTAIINHIG